MSENLSWDMHYKFIIAHAYKVLGLICRKFVYFILVRSNLLYCTQLWHLHLMKDILNLEKIHCLAISYILNDYSKSRPVKLKLLPLMYLFKLQDILFAVKSIKTTTNQLLLLIISNLALPTLDPVPVKSYFILPT